MPNKLNILESAFLYRGIMLFFATSFLNLIKTQIPLNGVAELRFYLTCLATIGVCVFYALTTVGAFFILQINMKELEVWFNSFRKVEFANLYFNRKELKQ